MLATILLGIMLLFVFYMIVKSGFHIKFCVLCAAISTTWLGLLWLYKLGRFNDPVILALLMGQSITGIFYMVESRVTRELRIFTLPFFLTLIAVFYYFIKGFHGSLPVFSILLILWLMGYAIFASRNDPGKKPLVETVINCCQDK